MFHCQTCCAVFWNGIFQSAKGAKVPESVTQYAQPVQTCYPTGMCSVRNKEKQRSKNSTAIILFSASSESAKHSHAMASMVLTLRTTWLKLCFFFTKLGIALNQYTAGPTSAKCFDTHTHTHASVVFYRSYAASCEVRAASTEATVIKYQQCCHRHRLKINLPPSSHVQQPCFF